MRLPYDAPEITLLGSVMELTQADLFAPGSDTAFNLPLLGDKDDIFS